MSFVYSPREKIADGVGHALSIAASIAGLTMLVIIGSRYAGALPVTSYAIYGGSLFLLFLMSALYHWITHARIKAILRVVDHSAIFVLIAGTYTPVTLISVQGAWGWSLFGVVWGIALAGVLLKTIFVGRFERLSIGLYLTLGWVGLVGLEPMIENLPWPALALLGGGGVFFCVGVIFHTWHKLPYHNAIWHLFVALGAITHYFSVVYYIRPVN
jgi:hemolysin III